MHAIGLHFGHDASGALVSGDGVVLFLDKERRSRIKQALGLGSDDIRELLADAGPELVLGLTSTQDVPMFLTADLEIRVDGAGEQGAADFFERLGPSHLYRPRIAWDPAFLERRGVCVPESLFPYQPHGSLRPDAMSREAELRIDGRVCRARYYQHHFLHACYAAWTGSPDKRALVITQDAGSGPSYAGGGIYFWTPGEALRVARPADGWIGRFYNEVGVTLGLDPAGAPGKLMGLAPYGQPIYLDPRLMGSRWQVSDGYRLKPAHLVKRWLASFGLEAAALPKWDRFSARPPEIIADLAASAQRMAELNVQELARTAVRTAREAGFDFEVVVLSGGVALNCPANSSLAATMDRPVVVPPAANDEGLSIGAAVAAYFDATGAWPRAPRDFAEAVYIGTDVSEPDVHAAAANHGWSSIEGDPVTAAAELLLRGEPVGLCVGRSEIGPRALGHRSILVDPASTTAWQATNRLKRREPWRPFAPAVLLTRAQDWFGPGLAHSPFMLFTYRNSTEALPAVTHVDRSARVQHVSAETGLLNGVLLKLESLGAPPVVLNTSFNGPGAPIVDTAEDAFAEASRLGLAHILTDFGLFRGRGATS
jgi:carbamoyltransferase